MNKSEAINLLHSEGWTKADAKRALEQIDFTINPDELTIRQATSSFAGAELLNRQRLQAAQKAQVTKKKKEISELIDRIKQYQSVRAQTNDISSKSASEVRELEAKIKALEKVKYELEQANDKLKKDNKNLKNIVDAIRLKLALETKKLLQYKDSELRQRVIKLFKSTLG